MRQNPSMDGSTAAAWVGAVGTVGSAAAAFAAWRAADAAARSSNALKAIESARRHQELAPTLCWTLSEPTSGSQVVELFLELHGPNALERLNRLHVRIRDDRPGRDEVPLSYEGTLLTPEEIRRQVWGPLRFSPGLGPGPNRADQDGRSVAVNSGLQVGEGLRFQLEATRHPWHWRRDDEAADADWRAMVGRRLRLTVTAFADGEQTPPWVIPDEVEVTEMKPHGAILAPSSRHRAAPDGG